MAQSSLEKPQTIVVDRREGGGNRGYDIVVGDSLLVERLRQISDGRIRVALAEHASIPVSTAQSGPRYVEREAGQQEGDGFVRSDPWADRRIDQDARVLGRETLPEIWEKLIAAHEKDDKLSPFDRLLLDVMRVYLKFERSGDVRTCDLSILRTAPPCNALSASGRGDKKDLNAEFAIRNLAPERQQKLVDQLVQRVAHSFIRVGTERKGAWGWIGLSDSTRRGDFSMDFSISQSREHPSAVEFGVEPPVKREFSGDPLYPQIVPAQELRLAFMNRVLDRVAFELNGRMKANITGTGCAEERGGILGDPQALGNDCVYFNAVVESRAEEGKIKVVFSIRINSPLKNLRIENINFVLEDAEA